MTSSSVSHRATVAILTFNGERYLRELLGALALQKFNGNFEILVIDSGSTDATLAILQEYQNLRIITIPNSEFSHGRTRDLVVREARGDLVAFLTQDAVPADENWLTELLAPLEADARIALVTGRQIPRAKAFPLQKYEIVGTFDRLGPRRGFVVYRPEDAKVEPTAAFHSDVNSAVRRELAQKQIPFRDVPYAEDQLMAKDILDAQLWKAYAGASAVIHSNDLTFREYGLRIFDETVGLRRIGFEISPISLGAQLHLTARGIIGDSLRIIRDDDFGWLAKLGWLALNPWYQLTKWRNYRKASIVQLDNTVALEHGSLEAKRRAVRTQDVDDER